MVAFAAVCVSADGFGRWCHGDDALPAGRLIEVPVPVSMADAEAAAAALVDPVGEPRLAGGTRPTYVIRLTADPARPETAPTRYEAALRLARVIASPDVRSKRVVVWVDGLINDAATLIAVAAEAWVFSPTAELRSHDETDVVVGLTYGALAEAAGFVPPPVAKALVDPETDLALIRTDRGGEQFLDGDALTEARRAGRVVDEVVWSAAGQPLVIDADRVRDRRWALAVTDDAEKVRQALGLASLDAYESDGSNGRGASLQISGPLTPRRVRRWQSVLAGVESDVTRLLVFLDSPGGNTESAVTMAANFIDPVASSRRTVGIVDGEARGDAALVALACRPLVITTASTLGGSGVGPGRSSDDGATAEVAELIARRTGRPLGLIRGLLEPQRDVYQFTEERTGRVVYSDSETLAEIVGGDAIDGYRRGRRLDLADGLSAERAVELGLADAVAEDRETAVVAAGFSEVPPPVADRPLVRFIEDLGGRRLLAFLLIGVAFSALSAEANSPGLGVGGFVALCCFGVFFWINFLSGTAEWFELIALVLGLICIAIEIFVVPGVGIFGIGGLGLVALSLVLMSQTFVIPQNAYQLGVLSRGVWTVLGGIICLFVSLFAFRMILPSTPLLKSLVMEELDSESLDRAERLGDFDGLAGRVGTAVTRVQPSGKAMFGDDVVAVVSEGDAIEKGAGVRVLRVVGTRVVVAAAESTV